jgi:hypothetical protein
MVILPTKMLRGALAFFARRKLQLKSRDPTERPDVRSQHHQTESQSGEQK